MNRVLRAENMVLGFATHLYAAFLMFLITEPDRLMLGVVFVMWLLGTGFVISSFEPLESTLRERLAPDAARLMVTNLLLVMLFVLENLDAHQNRWGLSVMIISGFASFGLATARPSFVKDPGGIP